jgi:hypothetical protein
MIAGSLPLFEFFYLKYYSTTPINDARFSTKPYEQKRDREKKGSPGENNHVCPVGHTSELG